MHYHFSVCENWFLSMRNGDGNFFSCLREIMFLQKSLTMGFSGLHNFPSSSTCPTVLMLLCRTSRRQISIYLIWRGLDILSYLLVYFQMTGMKKSERDMLLLKMKDRKSHDKFGDALMSGELVKVGCLKQLCSPLLEGHYHWEFFILTVGESALQSSTCLQIAVFILQWLGRT